MRLNQDKCILGIRARKFFGFYLRRKFPKIIIIFSKKEIPHFLQSAKTLIYEKLLYITSRIHTLVTTHDHFLTKKLHWLGPLCRMLLISCILTSSLLLELVSTRFDWSTSFSLHRSWDFMLWPSITEWSISKFSSHPTCVYSVWSRFMV